MERFCNYFEEKTFATLHDLELTAKLTLNDVEVIIKRIAESVLNDRDENSSFLLNPLKYLMEESQSKSQLFIDFEDILNTSSVKKIFSETLPTAIFTLMDFMKVRFPKEQANCQSKKDICLPVAKIIPLLNSFMVHNEDDALCIELTKDKMINQFSLNIYEAFCHTDQQVENDEGYGLNKIMQLFE